MKYNKRYNVDIVFCIDTSASMAKHLDRVKSQISQTCDDLVKLLGWRGVDCWFELGMRARLVGFSDYMTCGKSAIMLTDFFAFPTEWPAFDRALHSIQAGRSQSDYRNGLEALGYAIRSDWTPLTSAAKTRHIIMLWTDESAYALSSQKKPHGYPNGMAASFKELTHWWGSPQSPGFMEEYAKRLVLFAPAKEWWTVISETWDNVLMFESQAGEELDDVSHTAILYAIYE